ncbi:helix-turn-helix domain-containing protein [Frankia sp. Ag45/Mut15]|uniref:Helix-turn-helix domain-containing protein n=1 Tax=Frankia umida TaxID=573489 RepID=A0ABT0K410_9ACTN|nr:helix-turn-helix transcriptional regulator [Frankia umida]MCK9878262.1 helix-turn-helix domain-containing protein [Frankia umida]
MAKSSAGPTVRSRRLGAELRRLREAAGLTAGEAGQAIRASDAKISRIENGRVAVRALDVGDLLTLYGVDDVGQREAILVLARETRRQGWWRSFGDVVPRWMEVYIGLEADASSINVYQSSLVEGLLQTPEYAAAVIRSTWPELPGDEVRRRVALRTSRQERLTGSQPPRLWVVLDEAVLRRPVGGPDVLDAQLRHLLDAGTRPNVTIQVLPFNVGGHTALGTSFTHLAFPDPDDPEVVYLEVLTGSLYVEKPEEVRQYRDKLDHLRALALNPRDSTEMIQSLVRDQP